MVVIHHCSFFMVYQSQLKARVQLLWFFLLSISCGDKDKCSSFHPIVEYDVVEEIKINLDSSQQYYHASGYSLCEEDCFYFGFDQANAAIDVFDLKKQRHINRIKIFDDGPNQIINPLAILPVSLDSIFVMNDLFQLFTVNDFGEVTKEWKITSEVENFDLDQSILFIYSQPEMINYGFDIDHSNKKLYVRVLWNVDYNQSDVLWDEFTHKPIAEIDLKTGNIVRLVGEYPFDIDYELPMEFFPPPPCMGFSPK